MKRYPVQSMHINIIWMIILLIVVLAKADQNIPTTLDGPFKPVTRKFDPSLRRGSDDLPMSDPRLQKYVTSMFPEKIALAISSSTSMWVSWVTVVFFVSGLFWRCTDWF